MTKTRVIAALIMAPAAIAAIILLPTNWLAAAAALVFLTGLWEWLRLAGIDGLPRTILLALNLLLMVLLVWADDGNAALYPLTALIGVAGWVLALLWLRFPQAGNGAGSSGRMLKLLAGSWAIIPAWAALVLLHMHSDNGPLWLLTALATVWAADSGAYFAGRALGKHKLAPTISPNKTWEGLAGGVLAGIVAAVGFGLIAGASAPQLPWLVAVALVTTLFSVEGDLIESLLKRQAGAKDSGTLIPGHGGVLDRIDGVLAALPVFAIGKEIAGF
ncbi:MAG: phosphatidate cytidylyltransferase [Stenotrophomonas sp.]